MPIDNTEILQYLQENFNNLSNTDKLLLMLAQKDNSTVTVEKVLPSNPNTVSFITLDSSVTEFIIQADTISELSIINTGTLSGIAKINFDRIRINSGYQVNIFKFSDNVNPQITFTEITTPILLIMQSYTK
jgi:hypothetical protein